MLCRAMSMLCYLKSCYVSLYVLVYYLYNIIDFAKFAFYVLFFD